MAAVVVALTPACWPGWDFIFDQTPSREHRVEDLRVLAVISEPASIVLPPAYFFDDAEPAPIVLDVKPEIFDPRGGEIDVAIGFCVNRFNGFGGGGPLPGAGPTCRTVPGAPTLQEVVVADAAEPLGRVALERSFELTRANVLAIFEAADVNVGTVGGVQLGIVVNVGRTFDGKRERERAELFVALAMDVIDDTGISAEQHEELLAANFVADCSDLPPGTCFPGAEVVTVCGDGVVEGFEQCDPPEANVCDDFCFAFDFCFAARAPICLEPRTENQRPTIDGIFIDGGLLEPGGVIPVSEGEVVFLTPSSDAIENVEGRQRDFGSFCPEDSPGAAPSLTCMFEPGTTNISSENFEFVTWRFYIADGRAEIVSPDDGTGVFFGNPLTEPAGIAFTADTPVGTKEPLVLVLADSEGGMDIALFTLEAR